MIIESQKKTAESTGWFQFIPAIVADNEDPEHQHRIKVKLPHMDNPTEVHEEWVRQAGGFAGSKGYGNWDVPKKGSPVVLGSVFGEGQQLFYFCIYNKANNVPGDFEDETARGIRTDGDYKIIVRGDLIIEGGRVLIKSAFGTIQLSAAAGLIVNPIDEGGGGEG
ncbi:MAG: phage baseplate assembly protein V [Pyrinomonadaceae bacterium]